IRLYLGEKNTDKAKRMIADLANIAPDDVSLQRFVAQAFMDADDSGAAANVMRSLVKKHPGDVALELALAQILFLTAPEEARATLEDVQRIDPGNADAVVGLINLDLASNRTEEAIQHARDFASHDRVRATQLEANVLARTNQSQKAVELLDN